jgi:hypothetical protein
MELDVRRDAPPPHHQPRQPPTIPHLAWRQTLNPIWESSVCTGHLLPNTDPSFLFSTFSTSK